MDVKRVENMVKKEGVWRNEYMRFLWMWEVKTIWGIDDNGVKVLFDCRWYLSMRGETPSSPHQKTTSKPISKTCSRCAFVERLEREKSTRGGEGKKKTKQPVKAQGVQRMSFFFKLGPKLLTSTCISMINHSATAPDKQQQQQQRTTEKRYKYSISSRRAESAQHLGVGVCSNMPASTNALRWA